MQENKDMEKFVKGITLKFPQVVIQSRLGEKIQTPNNSNSDWFNISIEDYPSVVEDTKKALNLVSGESVLHRLPLCVEISLRTTDEGDSMVLEVWTLGISSDRIDTTARPNYMVYNRMSILLKSLISVTRVTPAYKLSRRQSIDSYQILYRIYVGDPEVHCLGDGYKQLRVGQLSIQTVGTLSMSVAYRTKMTISPTQTGRGSDTAMMLKSDHFIKDRLSPKQIRCYHQNRKTNEKKVVDLSKPMKLGAFVDITRPKLYSEEDYILPETPPFSWLLRKTREEFDEETTGSNKADDQSRKNNKENVDEQTAEDQNRLRNEMNSKLNSLNTTTKPSKWSISPTLGEQKLLKELHFPFATSNTPISDLAKFYRECTQAPPLQGMPDSSLDEGESDDLDDLTQKLEEFETAIPEFDSLVTSLGQSFDDPFSH